MTKQSQVSAPEAPTVDLLRKRFKLQDEYIESIRKDNLNAGVPSKYLDSLIHWRGDEFIERKRVEDFIAKVTDKKRPGHFWNISDLKTRGIIPEGEISEYEHRTYPYRRLNTLFKIKLVDGRLVLRRHETWYGLDANGQEQHRSFDFLDYYAIPRIEYDRMPADPQNPDGPTVRVKMIRYPHNVENDLVKEYITPYSKEKTDEFLKYAAGPLNEPNGTSLALKKEGVTNEVQATYEQFTSDEDFDRVFDQIRKPPGEFKDFLNEMKKRTKEAVDDADQYR